MDYLLMDFGTTSTKSAIVDLDTGSFSYVRSHPSLSNCSDVPGHYEISPAALLERFNNICAAYYNDLDIHFAGIAFCSEQNGFVALDEHNHPLTNYVSWKDERSTEPIDGISSFDLVTNRSGVEFKRISGWRPGAGLPVMNTVHLGRTGQLRGTAKIATLPEWLALCSGDSRQVVHDTMIHCQGLYDVQQRKPSTEIIALVEELSGVKCIFNDVVPAHTVSGYWHGPNATIPIFAGVGDHQCAVLGACNVPRDSISLNLGTGSQVAMIEPPVIRAEFEVRPYFDSQVLGAVTRIPGGRALADFVRFLEDICVSTGSAVPDFWQRFSEIDRDDIETATLDFDLAVFASAWGYSGGGSISNIAEGALTLQNYLASLYRSWVLQYPQVMCFFDPDHEASRCILSGGVARRLPSLPQVMAVLSGYETWPACAIDETLLGLRTIALVAAGRARSCLEGQEIFGRKCSVTVP